MNKSPYAYPQEKPLYSGLYGFPHAQGAFEFPVDAERIGTDSADAASHTINLPTLDVTAGDLMIAGVALQSDTLTSLTGFTQIGSSSENALQNSWLYRVCDGTEGSTTTLTPSASCPAAVIVALIKYGWNWTAANQVKYAHLQSAKDPPNLSVPGRGSQIPYLWISFGFNAGSSSLTDPGNKDYFLAAGGGSVVRIGYASLKKKASSHDSATFGTGTSNNCALTICIPPRGVRV